ncbi:MAG: ABC transporter substrate binding protein, partial [bacterium]
MRRHSVISYLLGISLMLGISTILVRGDDKTIVGFVLDGTWERNAEVRQLLERKIASRLGQSKVGFPSSKRLSGNWTRKAASDALDQLLNDPEVDLVVTLGLLSSHEAVGRESPAKPVIASRVVSSQLLELPARDSASGRISGVRNLTYITLGDLDLNRSIKQFQSLKPFRKMTFLTSQAFRDLSPDLEQLIQKELARAGVQQTQVIFVRSSIATAIASLSRESEAVVVTFLPQLDPEDYSTLLGALGTMRLPVFSVGGRTLVQLGALAGWGPVDATDRIAERVAWNVQRIVNGEKAENLPVELNIEPQLAINMETAGRFGISPQA